jgi:hypothetical protein
MPEKYLPIGTVVMLQNGRKELMITGYLVSENGNQNEVYDYSGCLYPEGIISSDQNAVFNHSQIQEILFTGFDGPKYQEFKEKLKTITNKE